MPKPRIAIPVSEWPARDRAGWDAAHRPGDQFDPPGSAAGWKFNTRDTAERAYGHWLRSLQESVRLDPHAAPHERCTPAALSAYVQALRGRGLAPYTVLSRIHGLNAVLRVICPGADLRHLDALEHRLKIAAVPVRNKAARLVSPKALFRLALAALKRVWDATDRHGARRYRDLLIVAFLTRRPIRLANLAAITRGHHLEQRAGIWWFRFAAAETKTRRPLRFPLPAALVTAFEHYLAVHRPRLLNRHVVDHLWISERGTALSEEAIYDGVSTCTDRLVGHRINPHLFRDIAATFVSEEAPEDRAIVADILGHTRLATSQMHYDHAGSLRAQQRLMEFVDRRAWGDEGHDGGTT